jgi:hypothetical protein
MAWSSQKYPGHHHLNSPVLRYVTLCSCYVNVISVLLLWCVFICYVRIRYFSLCLLFYVIRLFPILFVLFPMITAWDINKKQVKQCPVSTIMQRFSFYFRSDMSVSRENIAISGGRIGVTAHIWSWYPLSWLKANTFTRAHNMPGPELTEAKPGLHSIYEYLRDLFTSPVYFRLPFPAGLHTEMCGNLSVALKCQLWLLQLALCLRIQFVFKYTSCGK